jgi:Leucine-rich repeat (LRR) protein
VKYVSLANNGLTYVPKTFGIEVEMRIISLDLSDNPLYKVNESDFASSLRLRALSLSNTRLSRVPKEVLQALPFARYLYLDHNQFNHIEQDAFNSLRLKLLSLVNTSLIKIPSDALLAMKYSLPMLFLGSNRLVTVDPGAFQGTFINKLDLASCNLTNVFPALLQLNKAIEKLNLGDNPDLTDLAYLPKLIEESPKLEWVNLEQSVRNVDIMPNMSVSIMCRNKKVTLSLKGVSTCIRITTPPPFYFEYSTQFYIC